jgi:hypothetical protein
MTTQQAQIKINLPVQLKDHLASKAGKFGMPLAGYIKYLILKDVSTNNYPVFFVSEKAENAYAVAQKEEKEGKLVSIDELHDLLEEV